MSEWMSESSFYRIRCMVMEMQTEVMLVDQWLESLSVITCYKCNSRVLRSIEGGY